MFTGKSIAAAIAIAFALPISYAQTTTTCQPLNGTCPNDVGLATSTYSIDFTTTKNVPSDWAVADYETVNFGAQGAELSFAKRFDSPTFYTKFKFLFGHIEYVVQGAPGQGIVSSMVLLSDDLDEIDWEMTGTGGNRVETNYYGKGVLNYEVAKYVNVDTPQSQFHTYSLDWTADAITWSIDQVVVRTLKASDAGNYFPQTPMKVSLSLWDGGDPSEPEGTRNWAGGETNLPPPEPYTMYIKSVEITNAMPAHQYQYSDKSGSWQSIKIINEPFNASTSSVTSLTSIVASIPRAPAGTATIPVAQSNSSSKVTGTSSSIPGSVTMKNKSSTALSTSAVASTPSHTTAPTGSSSKSTSATTISSTPSMNIHTTATLTSLSESASFVSSLESTHGNLTTQIVQTTLSSSPVTNIITAADGSRTHQINTTVSTIRSTSTSTICSECVGSSHSSMTYTGSVTEIEVTTRFVHTDIRSHPVTTIITPQSGNPSQEVTTMPSTILDTSTLVTCTNCNTPMSNKTTAASISNAASLGELGISKQLPSSSSKQSSSSAVVPSTVSMFSSGGHNQTSIIAGTTSKTHSSAIAKSTDKTSNSTHTTASTPQGIFSLPSSQGLFSVPPASAVSAFDSLISTSSIAVAHELTLHLTMTPTSTQIAMIAGASSTAGNGSLTLSPRNSTMPATPPYAAASGSAVASPIALIFAVVGLLFL